MTYNVLKFLPFYFFCVLICVKADLFEFDPEWEKPDAWSRQKTRLAKESEGNDEQNYETNSKRRIPEPERACHEDRDTLEISKLFYKRLAKSLFNERKFKVIST